MAIIPVHNAHSYLAKTVAFLLTKYPKFPIVLVDDFSEPPISGFNPEDNEAYGIDVTILRNERQQLFTRTVNRGIRYAKENYNPNYYFVINSDCQFIDQPLEKLLQTLQNPEIGLTGYEDSPQVKDEEYTLVDFPNFVTGHCLGIKKELIETIGVLNETEDGTSPCIFPELTQFKGLAHIGSDREYCYRALNAGYKVAYTNYPALNHEAGKSWKHDLNWLTNFNLEPLWEPKNVY